MIRFKLMCMLLVLVLAAGCRKDEPEDNFRCRVDGELWRPRNSDLKFGHEAEAHLIDEGRTFFVSAYQQGVRQTISFAIFLDGEVSTGNYRLDGVKNTAEYEDKNKNLKFIAQSCYTGNLQILSLDKAAKRVTGRFSFKAVEDYSKSVATVSEGEFSLVYSSY